MARRERVWVVMVLGLAAMAFLFLAAPVTPRNADDELAAALEYTLKSGSAAEENRPTDADADAADEFNKDVSQGTWPSGREGQDVLPTTAATKADAEDEPTDHKKEVPSKQEKQPSPPPVRGESSWPDEDEDEEKPKNTQQGLPTSQPDDLPKKPSATSGAKDEQKGGGLKDTEAQQEGATDEGKQDNNDDEEAEPSRGEGAADATKSAKELSANEGEDDSAELDRVEPNDKEENRPSVSSTPSPTTTTPSTTSTPKMPTLLDMTNPKSYTLIIYIYWEKNPTYIENLNYFLRVGVPSAEESQRLGVTHLIIVQGRQLSPAVKVPSHVLVWRRPNTCFDYGAVGQALRSVRLGLPTFQRYVVLNSSVKGPFLPAYWPRDVHWSTIFTNRLSDSVKLVGTSIVCLPDSDRGKLGPRVEGFIWATDYIGIELGLRRGVFNCFRKKEDVVIYGEYGMSQAVLEANYTIDSLQLKYQGVDWTDRGNWNCNNFAHPTRANAYDGINMHPLETVFHKRSWTDINVDVLPAYMDRYAQWKYDQQTRESGVARPPV